MASDTASTAVQRRWLTLAICCLASAISYNNVTNYSIFLNDWTELFQVSNAFALQITSANDIVVGLGCFLVAPLLRRFGYRSTSSMGAILLIFGYAGGGLLARNIIHLVVLLGIIAAAGAAILTVSTLALPAACFEPERSRLWSCALKLSKSVGTMVRAPLMRLLIERFGALQALTAWAGCMTVLLLPLTLAMRSVHEQKPIGEKRPMHRDAAFALFALGYALMSCNEAFFSTLPKYGEIELGMSARSAALIVSLAELSSMAAVIAMMLLSSGSSERSVFLVSAALPLAALATVAAALAGQSVTLFLVMIAVESAFMGLAYVLTSAAFVAELAYRAELFGVEHIAKYFGVAYAINSVSAAVWSPLAGLAADLSGSFRLFFWIAAGLYLAAALCFALAGILVRRERAAEHRNGNLEVQADETTLLLA